MSEFAKIASRSELPPGSKRLAEVDGRPIAVFKRRWIVLRDRRRLHPRRWAARRRRVRGVRDIAAPATVPGLTSAPARP